MQLSRNFYLSEFEKSQTALRYGIDNKVREQATIAALKALCENVLQPLRDMIAKPITVTSGYRSFELNKQIRGSKNSQHMFGQAADIEVWGLDNRDLALIIQNNLPYDQLILEFYDSREGGNSGWVHVSYVEGRENRMEELTITEDGRTYRGF